ncbi:hypothetical protein Pla175_10470 [Pirellulimonas nuda]|uniref:Nickel uptake substrate-specific transmembrane region n=1 Tax=Pirellulimonas nuda TaxID=2528009 RepID=A0A518D868_9BACT|nr:carboxypeptidase-like regulatory domain-containing protein [Pirellulimonas nuda]QDU87681.1 hypothetical protein Pla175_10470 [Pirellulimonas nuda]
MAGRHTPTRTRVLLFSALAALAPGSGLAEGPPQPVRLPLVPAPATVLDVVLGEPAALTGQVTSAQGVARAESRVLLHDSFGRSVAATSNADGAFGFQGVTPGVYCLQQGDTVQACRVWTPETAPPNALSSVLIVPTGDAVLGQYSPPHTNRFLRGAKKVLAHPLAVAGIVGTAVAIPVAIHNANQDDDPSTP